MGAAEQILRKAVALRENRGAFAEDVRSLGMALADNFKVEPLVIVSTTTHVGVPATTVSVIDEFILGRFLDGHIEDVAYHPADPASSQTLKTTFYSTAAEAEDRAPHYFASPPQLHRFLQGLRGRVVPIYATNAEDWAGHFVTLDCVAGGALLSLTEERDSSMIDAPVIESTDKKD